MLATNLLTAARQHGYLAWGDSLWPASQTNRTASVH
jgi:hypothetical protein